MSFVDEKPTPDYEPGPNTRTFAGESPWAHVCHACDTLYTERDHCYETKAGIFARNEKVLAENHSLTVHPTPSTQSTLRSTVTAKKYK